MIIILVPRPGSILTTGSPPPNTYPRSLYYLVFCKQMAFDFKSTFFMVLYRKQKTTHASEMQDFWK